MFKKLLPFVVLLILSYPAYSHLLSKGYFPMHDDTQPSRVFEMAKSLKDGQFPVRIVQDLGYGYGYPIFNFYAPLPYYIGGIIYILSNDIFFSTKMMFLIGFLLATVSMYLLGKEIGGIWGGLVASTLYTYAPYHAVNLYVRGAVGELYAYAVLPFITLACIKIGKTVYAKNNKKLSQWIGLGSLSFAVLFLSHNILSLITLLIVILLFLIFFIYLTLTKKSVKSLMYIGISLLLGVGLSSFFTVPAILEAGSTKISSLIEGTSNFSNHFVYIDQLWNSPWGFAGSTSGRSDGMSFMIGKIQLLSGMVSILIALWAYKNKVLLIPLIILVGIGVFLTNQYSLFLWNAMPFFAFIQYPWRFLNIILLALCTLSAILVVMVKKPWDRIISISIVVTTILLCTKYFIPQFLFAPDPLKYTSKNALQFTISKISDEYLPKDFIVPKNPNKIPASISNSDNLTVIKPIRQTATEKKFQVIVNNPNTETLNIAFFKGIQATFRGRPIQVANAKGKVQIKLPRGQGILHLKFIDTPIRSVANTISFLSLLLVVYVSLFAKRFVWPKRQK